MANKLDQTHKSEHNKSVNGVNTKKEKKNSAPTSTFQPSHYSIPQYLQSIEVRPLSPSCLG